MFSPHAATRHDCRSDRRADRPSPRRVRPFRPDLLGMEKLEHRRFLDATTGTLTITLSSGS